MKSQQQLSADYIRVLLKDFLKHPNVMTLEKLIHALEKHRRLFDGQKS